MHQKKLLQGRRVLLDSTLIQVRLCFPGSSGLGPIRAPHSDWALLC